MQIMEFRKRICEQNKIIKLFINIIITVFNFWFHWFFVDACGLSLVVASRHYFFLWTAGFSMQGLLLLQSTGSKDRGFSGCSMPAPICSLWDLEHGLSSCWAQALALLCRINSGFFFFFCTETKIIKKEANREFTDALVIRIRCFHCCAWILFWSGNWDPSSCAIGRKREGIKQKFCCLRLQWIKCNKIKNAAESISNSRRIFEAEDKTIEIT